MEHTVYFYKCPIAAAWMAKHFGIKFGIRHHGKLIWDWMDMLKIPHPANSAEDILEDYPQHTFGYLYVHPDNLHLLEPQIGDMVTNIGMQANRVEKVGEDVLFHANSTFTNKNRAEIILRNGIAFISPESEAA